MIAQGPRQTRSRTSLADTTGGERDVPNVRPSVDFVCTPSASDIFLSVTLSTPLPPRLAVFRPGVVAAVRSIGVCRPRTSLPPSFSASSFSGLGRFSFLPQCASPPTWHSSVSFHTRPFFF